MTLKLVTDSFKEIFNDFLVANGYKWHKNFFAKYENGIFIRIYSVCKKYNNNLSLDVVVMPVPIICNLMVDTNEYEKSAISVDKLIYIYEGNPEDFIGEKSIDAKINNCYKFFINNYDKYFSYKSLKDFAKKMDIYYKQLFYDPVIGELHFTLNADLKLNCLDLAYVLYRTTKLEKCQKSIMNLIAVQKEILYNKIQYMNTINDKKLLQVEKRKYLKILNNYTQLQDFAEALLEENYNYLKVIDSSLDYNEIKSIEYIKKLTA